MESVFTGLPVLRLATNNFAGSLLARGRRHNFVYEWLAWCIATNEAGVHDIQSEFNRGESYVLIERSKYAAQIDLIWDETIGRYLEEEKQRTERERQEAVADVNASHSPSSSGDESAGTSEDESGAESRGGRSSRLSELIGYLDEALDEMDEEEEAERETAEIRPDLDTSPEGSEEEERGRESPPINPYQDAPADLHLMRRAAAARNLAARGGDEEARRSPPQTAPERPDPDDPRPPAARFRFSKQREILR